MNTPTDSFITDSLLRSRECLELLAQLDVTRLDKYKKRILFARTPYFSQVAQTTLAEVPEIFRSSGWSGVVLCFRGGDNFLDLGFKF